MINISSIKVSKDYPASFVLTLERNDIVTIDFNKKSGNADINQLEVRIIDLNQQEEETMEVFNRSGRDFLAKYDGNYRVDFIYNGKGSGIFRERSMEIGVSIDLDGYEGLKEGESKEVLHATNAVIEEGESNALKVVYYLNKGDKITVSSTDKKSAFLKLNITQQPKILSVKGSTVIDIMSDGTYTLNFYLDEDEEGTSLLNLRELLSKDDVLFRDLSIYRERAVDFSKLASSNKNSSDGSNTKSDDLFNSSSSNLEEEEGNGLGFDLEKLLSETNKGSEEFNKSLLQTMKDMQESLNKKNIKTIVTSIPSDLQMRLEPEMNFSSNNENRKCQAIPLQPTSFNIWFYWVGVGENAEQAYEEHNSEITNIYKKSFADVAAEHIYGKFGNPELGRKNPSYPDETRYGQFLNEDAEYAIVDFENMRKFMAGDRYNKLNKPARNATYITADNGISGKAANDEEMYFCACNNNKATPVSVFFKFIAIDYEEIEY
ncbi:hypothetical protein GCM10007940_13130 [Portibacter lacus]|uniref:Uncharacterized protein n=1 Tax=Portibacter lacus TaxID=1099794 RepID=A0AA37SQE3_9BACT|nr:hypothetical protein GCM10007940_13130 [Portibacter lacus]